LKVIPLDKKSLIGIGLIFAIVVGWMMYMSFSSRPIEQTPPQKTQSKKTDSSTITTVEDKILTSTVPDSVLKGLSDSAKTSLKETIAIENKFGKLLAPYTKSNEQLVRIETDNYVVFISSKGGTFKYFSLKNFKPWFGIDSTNLRTQLIRENSRQFYEIFTTIEGKVVRTNNLDFQLSSTKNIKITGSDSLKFTATFQADNGAKMVKTFTLYGDKYGIVRTMNVVDFDKIIANQKIDFAWENGLNYQERNSVDESNSSVAMANLNGSIEEIDASDLNQKKQTSATGTINYMAVKSKYFLAAMVDNAPNSETTVYLEGKRSSAPNEGMIETYDVSMRVPYRGSKQSYSHTLYVGPLDYDVVKIYGLEATVNLGWKFLVRPIGEYFMLPIINFIYKYIGNFGIAIILFSVLIKILLYPLSIGQMQSAVKMQLLQPEATKIREKYKDSMQEQQKAMMALYSEYGVNPMGGCLPMVLQMPILYALWAVLSAAIDLRQADFVFWIHDLSIPDVILHLPFKLPLLGIDQFSGLALLMGATLFIQQKMTITDPNQKMMIYLMPFMFTFMFSSFPAGLNLYYFMFNLLGILQQLYITKVSSKNLTLADMKKMPKKESWLQKKMAEAQEIASSQGRTVPGMPKQQASSDKSNVKKANYKNKK